jgi:general secretion pathway protein F
MTTAISIEQLVALNDEIASLVRAGVPLELGLRETGRDATGRLKEISETLAARMSSGASLAEALGAEQSRLPAAYRTVVEAGLRAGRLSAALESLSNYARELVELRRQVALALLYPLIVVSLAYLLFLVVIVDLVDRLRETYELFHLPIGWPLAIMVWAADAATRWWWVFPLCAAVSILWWMLSGGAHVLSFSGPARPLAWVPGVGLISRRFQFANFADLLGLLVDHDVPLPEAMRLSAEATAGPSLGNSVHQLAALVEQGNTASRGGYRYGFPPFLFWVLTQGRQSGELPRLLRHAATIYRRRAAHLVNWFKVVFPIVTALLIGGGVTGLYALTLFGPLIRFWSDLGVD